MASQITAITPYVGQAILIRQQFKRMQLIEHGALVTTVDNYQGEENDIVLLSLVRSNNHGSIGFCGVSNRVCVAPSRARHAMYIVGNLRMLAKKNQLWRGIQAREAYGNNLKIT